MSYSSNQECCQSDCASAVQSLFRIEVTLATAGLEMGHEVMGIKGSKIKSVYRGPWYVLPSFKLEQQLEVDCGH